MKSVGITLNTELIYQLFMNSIISNKVIKKMQHTYPVFLFEKCFENLFSEEEEVKASKHHCRLGHVYHGIKTKGLSQRRDRVVLTCDELFIRFFNIASNH